MNYLFWFCFIMMIFLSLFYNIKDCDEHICNNIFPILSSVCNCLCLPQNIYICGQIYHGIGLQEILRKTSVHKINCIQVISSRTFINFYYIFKSLDHLKIVLAYCVQNRKIIFKFSQNHILNNVVFPIDRKFCSYLSYIQQDQYLWFPFCFMIRVFISKPTTVLYDDCHKFNCLTLEFPIFPSPLL